MSRDIKLEEALGYTDEQYKLFILMNLNDIKAALQELNDKVIKLCDAREADKKQIEVDKSQIEEEAEKLSKRIGVLENGEKYKRAKVGPKLAFWGVILIGGGDLLWRIIQHFGGR